MEVMITYQCRDLGTRALAYQSMSLAASVLLYQDITIETRHSLPSNRREGNAFG